MDIFEEKSMDKIEEKSMDIFEEKSMDIFDYTFIPLNCLSCHSELKYAQSGTKIF